MSKNLEAPLFAGLNVDEIKQVETVSDEQAEKFVFDTVDFSDPNRERTCLEVDFPILKVNEISAIEQNATKPIYMMSKWWARRRASVFRQLLIAAATKAPKDETKAAQTSWALMYRKNHQKHGKFSKVKVLDVFMGGGTTVVEASRLGFNVTGVDLNPISWMVVKNETTPVSPIRIEKFYNYIKENVSSIIKPFYTASSPWGFDGEWVKDGKTVSNDINFLDTKDPAFRKNFIWNGPEVICTFWVTHIMCSDPSCNHLTPQLNSSIVAQKNIKLKYYENCVCTSCGEVFDLELGDFRIAPKAKFVMSDEEKPFAVSKSSQSVSCPSCKYKFPLDWYLQIENSKEKKSKEVTHAIVLSKDWMKGIAGKNKDYFGGYYGSSSEQDEIWFKERSKNLELIEVRGVVPENLIYSNLGKKLVSDADEKKGATGKVICGGCGRQVDPLTAIKLSGKMAPVFPYLIQGYDPKADAEKIPYGGRFFDLPNFNKILSSFREFSSTNELLNKFVPQEELFYGFRTYWQSGGLTNRGYSHWYKMFNPRQLYVNALLLKEIMCADENEFNSDEKCQMLGGWQNFLRHNCMFTIWNPQRDTLEPHFANNNYHPKATTVENSVFSDIGRGNFASCIANVIKGMEFAHKPYDLKVNTISKGGKSIQVSSDDAIKTTSVKLHCQSSTDLKNKIESESIDLIITDPPFGDNLDYSELADFFLVWLHKPLKKLFPYLDLASESPKSLEAVANPARWQGNDENGNRKADLMYDRLLTLCWKECYRVLKSNGILAFTFHHDKDVAWIGVLESLFKAGFVIETTFPIRSDSAKGNQDFGTKKIEFDIVHVCKKLSSPTVEIYWATLRKKIVEVVKNKSLLLAQHRASGLHLADLEVIIRGEVLEQYSKHYGKVKKNLAGDLMSVRDILLEANVIAQAMLNESTNNKVPEMVESVTRSFFGLFRESTTIEFNAARLRLKGSGFDLEAFVDCGWVKVERAGSQKLVNLLSISERWNSLSRKSRLTSDLDQAHFAINCCLGGKQLDGKPADLEVWIEQNYKSLLPSVLPILKYMESNHFGADYKQAIGIAHRTIERTLGKIKETDGEFKKASSQLSLFE